VKVLDLITFGFGALIGIVLGIVAFLKGYLPLKAGLGLDVAASQASIGDGPIVPMKNLVPVYFAAGDIIDLIVLLAFALAGAYVVVGVLRALRKEP